MRILHSPRHAFLLRGLVTSVAVAATIAAQDPAVGPAAGRGVRLEGERPATTEPGSDPAPGSAPTTGAVDQELILDADSLTSVYREAMQPLQETLRDSALEKRYAALAEMLKGEEVDGPALLAALRSLRTELDSVVDRLPGVSDSLWTGTTDLAHRIDEFRRDLARDLDRENGVAAPDVASDVLLRDLADRILALPEGSRERRILEQRFEATSLLLERARRVTDQLGGADSKVLRHILSFLVDIRASLHVAALRTTELSVAMQHQRKLVTRFEVLIENLIATDRLADTIEELTQQSGPTFGKLTEHMETLTTGLLNYADQLDARAAQVANQLTPALTGATPADGAASVLPRGELLRRIRSAATPAATARDGASPAPAVGGALPARDR